MSRPDTILDEAAQWLVVMHAGTVSAQERQAWLDWRERSAAHEAAWQKAERLMGKLSGMPAALAMPALDRPPARRAAMAKLAALLLAGPAAWGTWQLSRSQGWTADYRSATGEQRELKLADGTRLLLNTASAVDVRYDSVQREVLLRAGEIYIETAADGQGRPFLVRTRDGLLQALGTRFAVRLQEAGTRLAVTEGAVRITPAADGEARVVQAGQEALFTASFNPLPATLEQASVAWTQHMLLADSMPLQELLAELGRYRKGVLRCDPRVAAVRVSGTFPLDQTDRALAMLAATYRLSIASRFGGYWVTVEPA